MFAVWCPRHGAEVLLTERRVRSLSNLAGGRIIVDLECYDGERLRIVSGRGAGDCRGGSRHRQG